MKVEFAFPLNLSLTLPPSSSEYIFILTNERFFLLGTFRTAVWIGIHWYVCEKKEISRSLPLNSFSPPFTPLSIPFLWWWQIVQQISASIFFSYHFPRQRREEIFPFSLLQAINSECSFEWCNYFYGFLYTLRQRENSNTHINWIAQKDSHALHQLLSL